MSKQSLKYIPHFYFCGTNRGLLFTHYSGISSHSQGSSYNGQQDIAKFYDVFNEWTQSARGSDTINNYCEWLPLVKTKRRETTFGSVLLRVYTDTLQSSHVCYAQSSTIKPISSNLDHFNLKTSEKLISHIIRIIGIIHNKSCKWSSTGKMRHLRWPRNSPFKHSFRKHLMVKYNQLWKIWKTIVCGSWSIKLTWRVRLYRRAYGHSSPKLLPTQRGETIMMYAPSGRTLIHSNTKNKSPFKSILRC